MTEPVVIRFWGLDRKLVFPLPYPGLLRLLPVFAIFMSTMVLWTILETGAAKIALDGYRGWLLVCSGALLGLVLVAIFAMVFTQVADPDVEPLLSSPAVVIEWGYVSRAIVLLTLLAMAGPLISLLKTLLHSSP